MKITRVVAPIVAVVAAVTALTGCNSSSYSCSNGVCKVTLNGAGANTSPNDVEVTLVGASNGTATFTVAGQQGTCKAGETVSVGSVTATCEEVGDDKLVVSLK